MKNRPLWTLLALLALVSAACGIMPRLDFNPGIPFSATPQNVPTLAKPDAVIAQQVYDQGMSDLGTGAVGRDLHAALEHFTDAILADPTFIKAYNARGVTNVLLGKYDDARVDFENSLLLNPSYAPARENLKHLNAGEYDQAVAIEY